MATGNGTPLGGLVAVVPIYNVGERVDGVVKGLLALGCRVIAVDDGSTDGGTACLAGLTIELMKLSPNRGKGHAILAGFTRALDAPETTAVAVLDADGQHDPAELPKLYTAFKTEKADLLIGARDFSGGHVPFRSRFGNVVTVFATGLLLGRRLPDTQSGYRILSRRFAETVIHEVPGGRYETEMAILGLAIRTGATIASVPIKTIYEPGNATSHFKKVRDSWLIYRTLIRTAMRRK